MSTKIPLREWYAYLQRLLDEKTGYIYGTAGVLCTQRTINASIARYPENAAMTRRYGPQWIGHNVTDCSGVPLPIARKYGIRLPHGSSSLVRQGYIVDCGPDPHPGWAALADPTPDTPDNKHIGYVGPDGFTIYEARGTRDGFCTSTIEDKRWTKYGKMSFIDYGEGSVEPVPEDGGIRHALEGHDPAEGGTYAAEGGYARTRVYYRAEVITEKSPLNVRSGPGTEYGVLFKLARGSVVDVLFEYPSGWDWISNDGDHGYVSHKYLRKVEGAAAEETPSGTETSSTGETSSDGETSSTAPEARSPFPKGEGDGTGMTLLRCRENNVTIGLMGDWEIVPQNE